MRGLLLIILSLTVSYGFAMTADSVLSQQTKRKAVTEQPSSDHRGDGYFEKYVKPKSIDALISYCAVQWMPAEKDSFAAMPEAVAVRHHHYWYDIWINKMWGILVNDSGVSANFKVYGITDNPDKWLIILTSLHRKLNHQDINLPALVKEIKKKKRE